MSPHPGEIRTLVVWCPDWPLVAAGVPPDVPGAAFHANRVVACTAAARDEGVRRGLRRREAQGRCPELIIEQHDPVRDARVFEVVVAAVEAFTPRVEVTRPGACALPTRGPSRYFGGDGPLADGIRATVDAVLVRLPGAGAAPPAQGGARDVRCRVGVADGMFTAALAARRDVVVPPGESAAFLAPLPVELLDEPQLTDLLIRLGLRSLGELAALPVADVVGRFGPVGVTALRRAQGLDDRLLAWRPPPTDLTTEMQLDPPADRVDIAAFTARAMAEELCTSLSGRGLACTCVRIEAETDHGEQLCRVWRHHRAFTPATVAERVRWQLEGWLAERAQCGCWPSERAAGTSKPPPCPGGGQCPNPVGGTSGGLTLLRLIPEEVITDDGRQAGLWGGTTEVDDRAARGLARVQGLLGPDAVVTAVLGGGRGPADQVRLVPWGSPRGVARPGPAPLPSSLPPVAHRTAPPTAAPPPAVPPPPTPRHAAPPSSGSHPGSRPHPGRGRKQSRPSDTKPGSPGSRVRTSGRAPSPTEVPVWPGRVPTPSPAVVPPVPFPVEVVDVDAHPVGVTSRSLPTRPPAHLSVGGGPWEQVTAWAGPWTADERWWDPAAHRRVARLQVVLASGAAHLLALEDGRWWVEATYD